MTEVVTNSAASLQQSLAAERQLRGFGLLVQTRKQTPKALLLLRGRPARLLLMQWRDSPSLTNLKQVAAKIGRLALSSMQDVQQKNNKCFSL